MCIVHAPCFVFNNCLSVITVIGMLYGVTNCDAMDEDVRLWLCIFSESEWLELVWFVAILSNGLHSLEHGCKGTTF